MGTPKLQNTDGEALPLTIVRFEFDPAVRLEVEARLAALDGVEPPDPDDSDGIYTFSRPSTQASRGLDNTIIGTAGLSGGRAFQLLGHAQGAGARPVAAVMSNLGGAVSPVILIKSLGHPFHGVVEIVEVIAETS